MTATKKFTYLLLAALLFALPAGAAPTAILSNWGGGGGGGGASPGGNINEFQFNDGAGGFAGTSGITYSNGILDLNDPLATIRFKNSVGGIIFDPDSSTASRYYKFYAATDPAGIVNLRVDRNTAAGTYYFVLENTAATITKKTIDSGTSSGATRDATNYNIFKIGRSSVDCTARTDGVIGEPCLDVTTSALYVCNPTGGEANTCDTVGEWKKVDSTGISNGDAGDITVSNNGATLTIDNGAVTFAKLGSGGSGLDNRVLLYNTSGTPNIDSTVVPVEEIQSQVYNPTTPSNWTAWTANGASTLYDTIGEALDMTSSFLNALYSVTFGDWLVVADLTNKKLWTGPLTYTDFSSSSACALGQAAINKFLDIAMRDAAGSGAYRIRIKILGTWGSNAAPTWVNADTFALAPGGDYRRCWSVFPTFSRGDAMKGTALDTGYAAADGSAPTATNRFPLGVDDVGGTTTAPDTTVTANAWKYTVASVEIYFDNVFLYLRNTTNNTSLISGVNQPQVGLQIQNGYGRGFETTGTSYTSGEELDADPSGSVARYTYSGKITFADGGGTYRLGSQQWAEDENGGRPGGLPFRRNNNAIDTGNLPATAFVGLFVAGQVNNVFLGDLEVGCRFYSASGPDAGQNVCAIFENAHLGSLPKIRSVGGTGAIYYGSVQGYQESVSASYGKIGIQSGDPYNGGDIVTSNYCTKGFRVTTTGGTDFTLPTGTAIPTPFTGSPTGTAGDTGKVVTFSTGETALITAVNGVNDISYRLLTTSNASLAQARLSSAETLTCATCNGGAGIGTKTFASETGSFCGRRKWTNSTDISIRTVNSLEANRWGNLVVFYGYKLALDNIWPEQNGSTNNLRPDNAPSMNFGAGVCSDSQTNPYAVCYYSTECDTGTCNPPPDGTDGFGTAAPDGPSSTFVNDIRLTAAQGLGQKQPNDITDIALPWTKDAAVMRSQVAPSIALGVGCKRGSGINPGWGPIKISGIMSGSDVDTTANPSGTSPNCGSDSSKISCRAFIADPSATCWVDLSDATWKLNAAALTEMPAATVAAFSATPTGGNWYRNVTYGRDQVHCQTISPMANVTDYPIVTFDRNSFALYSSCRCASGTCTTVAAPTFEDNSGNALTGSPTCDDPTGIATWTDFSSGIQFNMGETLRMDVANSPSNGIHQFCVRTIGAQ